MGSGAPMGAPKGGVAGWKEERGVYALVLFNGRLQIGAVSMLVADPCVVGYLVRL